MGISELMSSLMGIEKISLTSAGSKLIGESEFSQTMNGVIRNPERVAKSSSLPMI